MKVSFVIPAYNSAAWLPHAVESCLTQTHKDIEVVIVNDYSTDTTEQYLKWLEGHDKRIKIINNECNKGRSASRNIGNEAATGDIIMVLDADDICTENRSELTIAKFKKGAEVVYGSAVYINPLGEVESEHIATPIKVSECLERKLNGIVHSTMAYTKKIAQAYPYTLGEVADLGIDDWEMQIRMLTDGVKFEHITDPLCAYRIMPTGISKTRKQEDVDKAKDKILEGLKCKI